MKKKVGIVVLWGALWGFTEATLGYVLHLLPANYGWAVWFPLAFFFMSGVRRKTGSNEAILYTAVIAAAIKFVNVLMPGSIDRVVNPATSILLEALSVYILYILVISDKSAAPVGYAGVFAASFLWRTLYAGYITLLPDWMVMISPVASLHSAVDFLLVQSIINGAVIVTILGVFRVFQSMITAKAQARDAVQKNIIQGGNNPIQVIRDTFPYCLLLASLAVTRFI